MLFSRFPRLAPVLVWTVWERPSLWKDGRGGTRNGHPASGRMAMDTLMLPWIVNKGDVSDTLQTFGIILTYIDMFVFFLKGLPLKPQTGSSDQGS